jgi:hypothetical protein
MPLKYTRTFHQASFLRMTAVLLTSLVSTSVGANPIECRQGELIRSIEIVYAEPGKAVPCEVMYNKPAEGTIEMLWQALNEAGYCEARVAEFTSKLESMGWQCSKAAPESPSD